MDWEDYNFPPCVKIIHYEPTEFPEGRSRRLTILQLRTIKIFIFICMINLGNNLVQMLQDIGNFKRVISSILTGVILIPLQLGLFYRLILGIGKD